jgi:hypothetical protein
MTPLPTTDPPEPLTLNNLDQSVEVIKEHMATVAPAIAVYGVWRENRSLETLFINEAEAYDYARRASLPQAKRYVQEHVLHGEHRLVAERNAHLQVEARMPTAVERRRSEERDVLEGWP